MIRNLICVLILTCLLPGYRAPEKTVTIYCALDQVFSQPLLRQFEKETGIRVNAIYDIEKNKTVGLVRTLIEEKKRPRCDVFWNNELAQTIKLEKMGILQPYRSPSAKDIPDLFKDAEGYWTGFAARARIFIVNTEVLPDKKTWPSSLHDLVNPRFKGKATMAKPLTGTTMTHMAALFTLWGKKRTLGFFEKLKQNEVRFAQGNAHVSKLVARGELPFGLTDTDDFRVRQEEGHPVAAVYPDAAKGGTLLIPNSVSLIKNCPRPESGKILIDWILRKETEEALAAGSSAQIPVRPDVKHPEHVRVPPDFPVLQVSWDDVAAALRDRADDLRDTFAQ